MTLQKVKKIIILGGGTSGWLTATYLSSKLKIPTKIELIESSNHQPIGVGEGTQPFTSTFLSACGIDPKQWMKPSNAAFKYGVELVGWNEKPYFVDNDHFLNHIIFDNFFAHDYFLDKDPEEYFRWLPAYQLARANKSPKLGKFDFNTGPGLVTFGAVHFSAPEIISTLQDICKNKVTLIKTAISNIKKDENGIKALVSDDGTEYTADLYIDCTGFSCELMEKNLGIEFLSYENTLPCNRAVALQTEYKNPKEECRPFTQSTAMNAGWRWTIPTYKRIGNGYVYSDKFISPDEAEKELRTVLNEWNSPARHLSMKCGKLKNTAEKNVCAVGLSAGFVEPLEATGITFTTKIVEWLTILLNENNNIWSDSTRKIINHHFDMMCIEIHAFIWTHYYFSTKSNTEFWKHFRNTPLNNIPKSVQDVLQFLIPFPSRSFYMTPDSMFHQGHWFSVLHSGGVYKNVKQTQSEEERKYSEYFLNIQKTKISEAIKVFPNHYEFLRKWYEE